MSASPDTARPEVRAVDAPRRSHGVVRRWVLACAAAEAVGMTAAAGAATWSQWLVGEPEAAREVVLVLGLVVAGGLVEGLSLGLAQSWALLATHPAPPPQL